MSKTIKLSAPVQNALDKFERAVVRLAELTPANYPHTLRDESAEALEIAREELTRLLLQQQSRLKSASMAVQRMKGYLD